MAPYAVVEGRSSRLFAFVMLFAWFVFYVPDYLGHADNYIEANPLVDAAAHRAGVVLPALLRDPARHPHTSCCGVSPCSRRSSILAFVPWLDTSRVRSAKYRPIYKWFFWLFVISSVALGYLGSKPPEGVYVFWARIFTAYYFLHFLVVMPIVGVHRDTHRRCRARSPSRCWARAAAAVHRPVRLLPLKSARPGGSRPMTIMSLQSLRGAALAALVCSCRNSSVGSGRARCRRGRWPRYRHRAAGLDLRRLLRASSTRPSCSAASRSIRRSAPTATASSALPSATSSSRAVRNSRKSP